jgi:hypothetical protein
MKFYYCLSIFIIGLELHLIRKAVSKNIIYIPDV